MIQIPFAAAFFVVSFLWILVRAAVCINQKQVSWKREARLLLVYICIVVVMRFTFFPFSKVGGRIQPLLFDAAAVLPPRINLIPFVNLLHYEIFTEMLINVIGNTAMFIPLGVVWPAVFKKLDKPAKVIGAGAGASLCIEILQLPFFDRVTDIDDLILNTAGFVIGYGIYLLVKAVKNCRDACKMR